MSWRLLYGEGWWWWLMIGRLWCKGGGTLCSCGCDWFLRRGGVGIGGKDSFLMLRGLGEIGCGLGGGAAAAAGAGDPVGGDAGVGLEIGGTNEMSLLCSWLLWRPDTLVELQVLGTRFSFVVVTGNKWTKEHIETFTDVTETVGGLCVIENEKPKCACPLAVNCCEMKAMMSVISVSKSDNNEFVVNSVLKSHCFTLLSII